MVVEDFRRFRLCRLNFSHRLMKSKKEFVNEIEANLNQKINQVILNCYKVAEMLSGKPPNEVRPISLHLN